MKGQRERDSARGKDRGTGGWAGENTDSSVDPSFALPPPPKTDIMAGNTEVGDPGTRRPLPYVQSPSPIPPLFALPDASPWRA